MIGYIKLYKPDLKFRDFYRYREYYCGLCRTLGKQSGQISRLSLGFDMTFLTILLDGVYDSPVDISEFRCPVHPVGRQRSRCSVFTEYAADMNLYLTCMKCRDDWKDDRNPVRGIYSVLLGRRVRKIEEKYRRKTDAIKKALEDLSRYERDQSSDFEGAAGCFGRVAEELFRYGGLWEEQLSRVGFYLGKYIYLLDAYEDLEEDLRKNRYNPLREMRTDPHFNEKIREILKMMISSAADEFELLPVDENMDILRNILYAGAWTSFEEIFDRKGTEKDEKIPDESPENNKMGIMRKESKG